MTRLWRTCTIRTTNTNYRPVIAIRIGIFLSAIFDDKVELLGVYFVRMALIKYSNAVRTYKYNAHLTHVVHISGVQITNCS